MRTKILYGDRIGREGKIRVGCSAIIFDESRRVLLTRRADNGQWCMPGGAMEPGESAEETCVREVFEETGLQVEVTRMVGVYSNQNQLVVYDDSGGFQIVVIHFEAQVVGGTLGLSDETTDFGYFSLEQMNTMDLVPSHRDRIKDSLDPDARVVK